MIENFKGWKAINEETVNIKDWNKIFTEQVLPELKKIGFVEVPNTDRPENCDIEGSLSVCELSMDTVSDIESIIDNDLQEVLDQIDIPICVDSATGGGALDQDGGWIYLSTESVK